MNEHQLSPRASVISFVATSAIATAAATSLFLLLDPRTQAYWGDRLGAFVDFVRALFVR
jgi:hypothetical protein